MNTREANSATDIAVATCITFIITVIITTAFGSNVIYSVNINVNEVDRHFKENKVDNSQKGTIIINNNNYVDNKRS